MIEEQLTALIQALNANTAALHAAPVAKIAPVEAPAVKAPAVATPAYVPPVVAAPVSPAAASAIPPVAAAPVAVSPSEVTLEQLKAEVTQIYQMLAGDPRIMEIVTRYGGDLNSVNPAQYNNLLNEIKAL